MLRCLSFLYFKLQESHKKATYEESKRIIISDLKVLPGIGPVRELALRQQGYNTIEDLENHPIWQKEARKFIRLVDKKEVDSTQKWLWQRLPKSHPLLHYLAGFCQDQDFAIIDIETLGLSERPIILLGIAKINKDKICTSQFLLRDIPDEPGAIWALVSQLEPKSSLITYNGRSFDIPYIKQRLAYYGLCGDFHFKPFHDHGCLVSQNIAGKKASEHKTATIPTISLLPCVF